jgi:4-alpha-glucanotransferase
LLSLEIQRMPKDLNRTFSRPADAPYLSVVTPSTHDMSTLRGWWLEDRRVTQVFYEEELRRTGTAPADCPAEIVTTIIRQHLQSPAMWSIFQLQDLLGASESLRAEEIEAERINVPAITPFYWRYRMHLPLEQLLSETSFNTTIRAELEQSARIGF